MELELAEVDFQIISGQGVFLVDAKYPQENEVIDVKLGMLSSEFQKYGERGQANLIAQFYKLVSPGMILSRHIFRGLERPLYCDENMEGDKNKLIYSRKPSFDYEWIGGKSGKPIERVAPAGKVFTVIVSPNMRHKDKFSSIYGWIERWNWIEEDTGLSEAPMNWVDRYKEKIYTGR